MPTTIPLEVRFTLPHSHVPALRSAIDDIRQQVGGELEKPHRYAKEDTLTRAAAALARLHAALCAICTRPDPDYA